MAFCTSCGHSNAADNRFCDECGKPLRQPAAEAATPPSVAASSRPHIGKRGLFVLVGSLAVLLLAGVGGFFLLVDESPSPANLQAAVERYLAAHPDFGKGRYCLKNFPYEKDPVLVAGYDSGTQRWMNLLVSAGLYGAPQEITNGNGFLATRNLSYGKTDAGKAATSSGALCVASGVSPSKVDAVQEQRGSSPASVVARVTFSLKNPMPLVHDPAAQDFVPGRGEDGQLQIRFVVNHRKWEVASPDAGSSSSSPVFDSRRSAAQAASDAPGFLSQLTRLFSFGTGNPLLGKWHASIMGIAAMTIEFLPDEMRTNGDSSKVRYEVRDGEVIVFPADQTHGQVVRILDANTIVLNVDGMELRASRVR